MTEMTQEMLTKEIEKDLGLKLPTGTTPTNLRAVVKTVTSDIEALKSKLDTIAKGINLLRDQL